MSLNLLKLHLQSIRGKLDEHNDNILEIQEETSTMNARGELDDLSEEKWFELNDGLADILKRTEDYRHSLKEIIDEL